MLECASLIETRTTCVRSLARSVVMEKTIAALMLVTPRVVCSLLRKAEEAMVIRHRDTAHATRASVATTMRTLFSKWCPLLLYLGQLVRKCNWSRENNGTGACAQEVL